MAIWMHAVRCYRIGRGTAAARWQRVSRRVPRHIGEGDTGVGRANEGAPVVPSAVEAVVKGTTEVHHIGFSRR